jgi:predicted PurR-regulated permease PerM
MKQNTYTPDWQRALIALSATVVAVAIVAALYWARSILIPVALAIFLTFVLSPAVAWIQRRGLGRTPAVFVVIGTAILTAVGVGTVVTQQMAALSETLPDRRDQILDKITMLKQWVAGNGQSRLGSLVEDVLDRVNPGNKPRAGEAPQPVVVESSSSPLMSRVEGFLSPAAEFLGLMAFAFLLTVYMLLRREDLRNRMIRLLARGKVTTTTKAVDDASRRISRYLLTQLVLNAAFGAVIAVALLLIGMKYALLWAVIAFLMRYVPYIGTWIGLIPPTLYAVAVSEGPGWWWQPVLVLGIFAGLELLCNNIFEPMLYGPSMGLSEVAQLIAAGFWAFLWGPIGLILSGPLTVCLLVLGKYVSQFQFLQVLLGDEPALEPRLAFYQRLTARDQDEASDIAAAATKGAEPEAVFDDLIIPALCLAKRDHADGDLSDEALQFALRAAREIGEEVADEAEIASGGISHPNGRPTTEERVSIVLCPAREEVDLTALGLLARVLDPARWEVHVAAVDTLASELLDMVEKVDAAVVVIASLPPGGLAHSRYLATRLRRKFPDLKLIVGRWGRGEEFPEDRSRAGVPGTDWVDDTLSQTRKHLYGWYPVFSAGGEAAEKPKLVGTPGASHD